MSIIDQMGTEPTAVILASRRANCTVIGLTSLAINRFHLSTEHKSDLEVRLASRPKWTQQIIHFQKFIINQTQI